MKTGYRLVVGVLGLLMLVSELAHAASLEWDANGTTAPNPSSGTGNWDATSLNWWNTSANVVWDNSGTCDATFTTPIASGNQNVTVVGARTVSNLTVSANPYYFKTGTGAQLTINGNITAIQPARFDVPIVGASALNFITGGGELTKSNSYTGATTVTNGGLTITANGALGSAGAGTTIGATNLDATATLYLSGNFDYTMAEPLAIYGRGQSGGGALQRINGSGSFAGPITIGPGGAYSATIKANAGCTNTLTGVISDDGNSRSLIIAAGGTVVLSGSNTYGGGTSIGNGNSPATLIISSEANLGAVPGAVDSDNISMAEASWNGALGTGSKLRVTSSVDLHANRGISFTSDKSVLEVDAGGTFTVNGGLSRGGAGGFIKQGSGTLVLTASATAVPLVGPVIVNAGTLQIGNGGTTGILPGGTVTNNSVLVFNRSDSYTVPRAINGTGTVIQNGPGTVVINVANSYTGPTVVSNGTLTVTSSGSLASTNWTMATNAVLAFGSAVNLAGKVLTSYGSGTTGGLLTVTGNLTLGGKVVVTGTESRKIAQCTGAISGSFDETALPYAGAKLVVKNSNQELWIEIPKGSCFAFR